MNENKLITQKLVQVKRCNQDPEPESTTLPEYFRSQHAERHASRSRDQWRRSRTPRFARNTGTSKPVHRNSRVSSQPPIFSIGSSLRLKIDLVTMISTLSLASVYRLRLAVCSIRQSVYNLSLHQPPVIASSHSNRFQLLSASDYSICVSICGNRSESVCSRLF